MFAFSMYYNFNDYKKRNFKFKMDVHVFCYSYCLWNYYLHVYNRYLELICCIIYNKLNSYIIIYSIKNI